VKSTSATSDNNIYIINQEESQKEKVTSFVERDDVLIRENDEKKAGGRKVKNLKFTRTIKRD